ncbi:arylsulfatase [Pontiella sp.]|uniref:sulfatase family protein n=1 Tax=Pontiella sp. TaxID=2837462 RepID=UPI00356A7B3B
MDFKKRLGVGLLLFAAAFSGNASAQAVPGAVGDAEVPARAQKQPNVVFILADDLGYGDLGCYGATKVKTPNIDQLASEGRRFTDAHSASAVCSPSRYGLLTGEYPFRGDNGKGYWGPCDHFQPLMIATDKLTLAQVFKNKGYATAAFGKWHLGFGEGKTDWNQPLRPGPLELGFDYYFGVPKVNSGFPFVYVENDRIVGYDPNDPITFDKPYSETTTYPPEAGPKTDNRVGGAKKAHAIYDDEKTGPLLVDKAVSWISENKMKPFFVYFPTTNIHHPFTPSAAFKGSSECGLYGDFIQEFDWMVGELVKCLEENDLVDNTLIIVTSDNGGMFNRGGQDAFADGHRQNGELLGFKFGVWEGGQRVPFVAKWPGKIPPNSVSDQLISGVDMLATFAALTGQAVASKQLADSINVLPALVGDPEHPLRNELVLIPRQPSHVSIRKGKWIYIPQQAAGGFKGKPGTHGAGGPAAVSFVGNQNSDIENGKIKKDAPPAQLYDLSTDVNQTKNLYNEYPEVVQEMKALLARHYRPARNGKKK